MDYIPFNISGLSTEDIDRYQETWAGLKDNFNIQPTGHIDFNLEQFEVFKPYLEINTRDSFVIKQHNHNNGYVLFIETNFKTKDVNGHIIDRKEHQTWALAYLKHDFGRVLIRPETLTDKIIELIHPVELDFKEDKAFSDTFYVLINDYEKAVKGIDRNFRNAVMDVREDDFVVEIVNHTLIIGTRKAMLPEKAVYLAEFVVRLCGLC